jgi:hypothetical protein
MTSDLLRETMSLFGQHDMAADEGQTHACPSPSCA